jgi:hypothetical protein
VGYTLKAVVGDGRALRELSGRAGRVVFLGQHLSLLPVTDDYHDAVSVPGAAELAPFWRAPTGFADALAACSVAGPVAYLEADYFGGAGTQVAQVWDRGEVVLGPLTDDARLPFSAERVGPISAALCRLGVVRGGCFDEFEAVGLGRHRDTEDWLADA